MFSPPHRLRTLGAIIISLIAVPFFPYAAFAQSVAGMKITPSLIEERADPGAERSYTIRVENQGEGEQLLYPRTRDILGVDSGGQPVFAKEGEHTDYALSSWVNFNEESLLISSGQSIDLHFTVRIPSDVTPGAHVGSITLSSKPPAATQTGSAVGYEIGAIISFRVSGDVIEDTRLREFFADRLIYSVPDARFTARLENLGNVFVRPKGFVDIKNMWGRKVSTLTVNDGGASIFPKSEREYTADWKSGEFEIGKYTAELTLSVEGINGMQTLLATTVFWVIPTNIIVPVLGGILVFLLLFYILLRLYVRKQLNRMTGGIPSVRIQEATSLSRFSVIVIALVVSIILGLTLLFLLG